MSAAAIANGLVAVHIAYALFIVIGWVLIVVGGVRGWAWVRNPWFRAAHLLAILIVVAETQLGIACPLTYWEDVMRSKAGQAGIGGDFFGHYADKLLYWPLPPWFFAAAYAVSAAVIAATLVAVPPRWPGRGKIRPPGDGRAGATLE